MPDNKLPQDEKTVFIPVTGKQLGFAILAILTVVGGPPILNFATPDARNDPFTGSEGDALELRIATIERAREQNEDKLENFDLKISLLERHLEDCDERAGKQAQDLAEHLSYSSKKVEAISKQFALVETKASINEKLINQCMRITGK